MNRVRMQQVLTALILPIVIISVVLGSMGCNNETQSDSSPVAGLDPALQQAVEAFHTDLGDEALKTKIMKVHPWSFNGSEFATIVMYHKHIGDYPPNTGCPSLPAATSTTGCGDTTWSGGSETIRFGESSIFHLIVLQAAKRSGTWTVHALPEDILTDASYLDMACKGAEAVIHGVAVGNKTL